ncbi:hypothetical protein CP8484711_2274D, partial [Chlamydia psittaci 84-8471/1]
IMIGTATLGYVMSG